MAPHISDALHERIEVEPVWREEERAVDVEEEKR
jgi:hypothetical protein